MMSDLNITTTIAQLPNIQGMAAAQIAHPEVQQVFAAQLAQQAVKEQHQQVQKVDRQEGSDAVKEEKEGRQDPGHHPGKRKAAAQKEPEPEEQPASASPWIGHLVDRKV